LPASTQEMTLAHCICFISHPPPSMQLIS
jgi:hypothetical protein